jgi:outer membrane protein assembly factor BamB
MKTNARLSTSGPQCAAFAPLLPVLADTLDVEEQIALQNHLQTCAHCRAQVASYKRLDDALRLHLGPAATPRLMTAQILQGIEPEEQHMVPQAAALRSTRAAPLREDRLLPCPPAPRILARRFFPARLTTLAALVLITLLIGGLSIGLVLVRQHNTPATTTADNIYLANDAGEVYKLDGRSHAVRWMHRQGLEGGDSSTALTVVNGTVYGIAQDGGLNAFVYALKGTDGSLLWTTPAAIDLTLPVVAPPLVADGVVYFLASRESAVYALNAATGKVLWHTTVSSPPGDTFIGWSFRLTLADGVLYGISTGATYATPNMLFALHAADGTLLWKHSLPEGKAFSAPTLNNGVLYLEATFGNGDQGEQSMVYAFGAQSGSERWHSQPIPGSSLDVLALPSGPTVANGVVYVEGYYGLLSAFHTRDGTLLWSSTPIAGGLLTVAPQVVGQTLYLVGKDTHDKDFAAALDARSGAVLWSYRVLFISQSFAVKNNVFYLSLDTGWVYALRATDGKELWHTRYIQHFSYESTQITIAP